MARRAGVRDAVVRGRGRAVARAPAPPVEQLPHVLVEERGRARAVQPAERAVREERADLGDRADAAAQARTGWRLSVL